MHALNDNLQTLNVPRLAAAAPSLLGSAECARLDSFQAFLGLDAVKMSMILWQCV
jgi:hypothetical protein